MDRNLRAVFLDRDGVINREGGHVCSLADFVILDGISEAIARLNKLKIKVIIVTNQSGLARGIITEEELDQIHQKLRDHLSIVGGHLDRIYISPWHPDTGLPNGVQKWLGENDDRKPGAGMLRNAMEDFGVDASEVVMIGDSKKDKEAAEKLGIKFYGVKSNKASELASEPRLYRGLDEVVAELLGETD